MPSTPTQQKQGPLGYLARALSNMGGSAGIAAAGAAAAAAAWAGAAAFVGFAGLPAHEVDALGN